MPRSSVRCWQAIPGACTASTDEAVLTLDGDLEIYRDARGKRLRNLLSA
jgi:hypothetical protein